MEKRVKLFYELHNNKWFHIMNWSLAVMLADKQQKRMITKYGSCFYF